MVDMKWLAACATAGEFLYGFYTVSVLKQMYEYRDKISVSDLIAAMQKLEESGQILMSYLSGKLYDNDDDDLGFFVPVECEGTPLEAAMKQAESQGNPYASLHLDEDERIDLVTNTPLDLDFYIPTEAEIVELSENACICSKEMKDLEEQARIKGGNPEALIPIWQQISTGKLDAMECIQTILDKVFPDLLESMEDLNALMLYINKISNSVNRRDRKGWCPNELFKKEYPNGITSMPVIQPGSVHAAKSLKEIEAGLKAMGAKVDYSSIDNYVTTGRYGERRMIKVGRNDPCPCGSGKKYKRCHGR